MHCEALGRFVLLLIICVNSKWMSFPAGAADNCLNPSIPSSIGTKRMFKRETEKEPSFMEKLKSFISNIKRRSGIGKNEEDVHAFDKKMVERNRKQQEGAVEFGLANEGDYLPLRNVLARWADMPISDDLLTEKKGIWFVKNEDGEPIRIRTQGSGRTRIQEDLAARTELGKWYRFCKVTSAFRDFLNNLPMLFDSSELFYDNEYQCWFAFSEHARCYKKLVSRGSTEAHNKAIALGEDGRWYTFSSEPKLHQLKLYASRLPLYRGVGPVAIEDTETEMPVGGPKALGEALLLRNLNVTTNADLIQKEGIWFIANKAGGMPFKIVSGVANQGVYVNHRENGSIFIFTDNGVVHRLKDVPNAFRQYVYGLPVHYYTRLLFDGVTWYVKNVRLGTYMRLKMRGFEADDNEVTILAEDGLWYYFISNKYFRDLERSLSGMAYQAIPLQVQ